MYWVLRDHREDRLKHSLCCEGRWPWNHPWTWCWYQHLVGGSINWVDKGKKDISKQKFDLRNQYWTSWNVAWKSGNLENFGWSTKQGPCHKRPSRSFCSGLKLVSIKSWDPQKIIKEEHPIIHFQKQHFLFSGKTDLRNTLSQSI